MKHCIKGLKYWIHSHRLIHQDTVIGGIKSIGTNKMIIEQQDMRSINAVKNIRKAFEQQAEDIKIRSLKSHRIDCDVTNCNSDKCFIKQPDKVVSTSIEEIPKKRSTRISMGKYENLDINNR